MDGGGNEFAAAFFWNADGSYASMQVREFGPRDAMDHAARDAIMQKLVSDLGAYAREEIVIAPFSDEAFGTTFGFVPQAYDDTVSVNLMPGDSMAFFEPWDSGAYDT